MLHVRPGHPFHEYDWKERRFSKLEFAQDFLLPFTHARMTMGLSFFAEDGLGRAGLSLLRSSKSGPNERERATLIALAPRFGKLYGLHRRLGKNACGHVNAAELARGHKVLSPQEAKASFLASGQRSRSRHPACGDRNHDNFFRIVDKRWLMLAGGGIFLREIRLLQDTSG